MKPASVAVLKELQEKLEFWSTWEATRKEWYRAYYNWCDALEQKFPMYQWDGFRPEWDLKRELCETESSYGVFVEEILEIAKQNISRQSVPPLSEAEAQAIKEDMMAMSKELQSLSEKLQSLTRPALASEAKRLSAAIAEILEEFE